METTGDISNRTYSLEQRLNWAFAKAVQAINNPKGQMLVFSGAYAGDLITEYVTPYLIETGYIVPNLENGGVENEQYIYKKAHEITLSACDTKALYEGMSKHSQSIILANACIGSHESTEVFAALKMLAAATQNDHVLHNPEPRDLTVPRTTLFQGVIICIANEYSKRYWQGLPEITQAGIEFISLEVPFEEKLFADKAVEQEWTVCHKYCFDFLDSKFDEIFQKLQAKGTAFNLTQSRILYEDMKATTLKYILPQPPTIGTLKDVMFLTWYDKKAGKYPKGRELLDELRISAFGEEEDE